MEENEFKIIINKLDDIEYRLKEQTKLTEEQINELNKRITGILSTIIRLMKKETDTKDNWKGTGFFGNMKDEYK